jgi:WD40 repeat protein/serine/threonine protein kinase/tetratricopeptide (TPR) repeat protein
MSQPQQSEKSIFLQAIEIQSAAERAAYLDQACAGNQQLRAEIDELLQADARSGDLLDAPSAVVPGNGASPAVAATIDMPPAGEAPGTVIGPYKLLEQIGEGGFGVVFMAEQTQPVRRKVALKVLKPGMDTKQVVARFEAERQALALMDHPNIAKVFDGGATPSGRPYFVMELVRGTPMTAYCDEHQLPLPERLELFVTVCQAVQHAHQKGIIHRDIKPSNILVTQHDDRPVVKVIDFGVAKAASGLLTDKTLFTGFAQMVGTPLYMSPEQAALSGLDVDTRSDIYSLGVLLYELLTGTTPFDKERLKSVAFDEIRRIIREEEPQKPSTRLSELSRSGLSSRASGKDVSSRPGPARQSGPASLASISAVRKMEPRKLTQLLRGDLDWIVMKALEKDRTRRYATAVGLATDVQKYLADEPVEACPPSAAYRFRKFARRNRGALLTAITVAAVLVVAVVGLAVSNLLVVAERDQKIRALDEKDNALKEKGMALEEKDAALTKAEENFAEAKRQERLAKEQKRLAQEQELLARRRFYAGQMNLAMQAWQSGEISRVLELLEGQRPKPGEQDLRAFEWYYLWGLAQQGRRLTLHGHKGGVRVVAFLPDGKTLASCGGGEVRFWDWATGKQQEPVLSGARCMAVSADGKILATGSGHTTLYNLATMKSMANLQTGWVSSLAFSPDGSTLVTGTESGAVMLWDIETGKKTITLSGLGASVLAVTLSPDGKSLAAGTGWGDGVTSLWDLTVDPPRITHQFRWAKNGLTFFPDGRTLLIAGWGSALFYDVTNGQLIQDVELGSAFNWVSAAISPDTKTLAFGLEERTVKLWDRAKGQLRSYGHLTEVWCVAFSPDGKVVAAGTEDGTVQLWNVFPEPELTLPSEVAFNCAALSRDREMLALGANDGKVKLWDLLTGQERTLAGHSAPVRSVAFSTDGKALASASGVLSENGGKGEVKVWEAATGREVATLDGHQGSICSIAFSPDGQTLASGSFDGTAKLWDVGTREAKFTLTGRRVTAVAFSPHGKTLATGGQGGVTLWDTASGQKQAAWVHPGGDGGSYVFALAFSPNGRLLATGGSAGTGTIKLWDAETGESRASLKGHTTAVYSVAFGPDGQTLASASSDGSVRLWDVATGQERVNLKCPRGPTWPFVTFAPDGNTLVMGRPDGIVQFLRAALNSEADSFRRPFNSDEPGDLWVLGLSGHRLWSDGRVDDAEVLFRQAASALEKLAAAAPESPAYQNALPGAWFRLGLVLVQSGRSAEAEPAFNRAHEVQDKLPVDDRRALALSGYVSLGNMLRTAGQTELAHKAYEQALDLRPDDLELVHTIARLCLTRGDWAQAIAVYDRAIERSPETVLLKVRRSQLYVTHSVVWGFDTGSEGWGAPHNCTVSASNGILSIQSTAADPWVEVEIGGPAGWKEIILKVKANQQSAAQLFWKTDRDTGFAEDRSVHFDVTLSGAEWIEVKARFHPTSRLTDLRLDPDNSSGIQWEIETITLANIDAPPVNEK